MDNTSFKPFLDSGNPINVKLVNYLLASFLFHRSDWDTYFNESNMGNFSLNRSERKLGGEK